MQVSWLVPRNRDASWRGTAACVSCLPPVLDAHPWTQVKLPALSVSNPPRSCVTGPPIEAASAVHVVLLALPFDSGNSPLDKPRQKACFTPPRPLYSVIACSRLDCAFSALTPPLTHVTGVSCLLLALGLRELSSYEPIARD